MSKTEISLSNIEILKIQEVMQEYNKEQCKIVEIPTHIGTRLEVHLGISENKVLVCDITDYNLW